MRIGDHLPVLTLLPVPERVLNAVRLRPQPLAWSCVTAETALNYAVFLASA